MPLREFNKIETPAVLTKNLKTMKFLLKDSSGSMWTRFRKHNVIGNAKSSQFWMYIPHKHELMNNPLTMTFP